MPFTGTPQPELFDGDRTLPVTSREGGMRELALQKRLGHASPESIRIYTRVSDEQVLADYDSALRGRS